MDFPSGDDEFTALIASFNRMSERLARSEEEVEHSRSGLTRKNEELEQRRRLMETVFETVGTGIVVVDAEETITGQNAEQYRAKRIGNSPPPASSPRRLGGIKSVPGSLFIAPGTGRRTNGRITGFDSWSDNMEHHDYRRCISS